MCDTPQEGTDDTLNYRSAGVTTAAAFDAVTEWADAFRGWVECEPDAG